MLLQGNTVELTGDKVGDTISGGMNRRKSKKLRRRGDGRVTVAERLGVRFVSLPQKSSPLH